MRLAERRDSSSASSPARRSKTSRNTPDTRDSQRPQVPGEAKLQNELPVQNAETNGI